MAERRPTPSPVALATWVRWRLDPRERCRQIVSAIGAVGLNLGNGAPPKAMRQLANYLVSGVHKSCPSYASLPSSPRRCRSDDRDDASHIARQSTFATSRHRTSQPLVLVCSAGSTPFDEARCNRRTRLML